MSRLRFKIQTILQAELESSRSTMQWGGLIGLIAHPIYFFVWTYLLPQPYDNLYLRLSAAFFCIPPLLQKYWGKRFGNYLVASWHFCLIYALPFVCTLLTIKNSFSTMWMMTEVMMIFIMALCIHVLTLLVAYIFLGTFAAFVAVLLTTDMPLTISATDQANLALLPVVIICSMVFSRTIQKGQVFAERSKVLAALAGSIAHEMRNPLEQMKHALNSIGRKLPLPTTGTHDQSISAVSLGEIYADIEHGLRSSDRGMQVIDMTLREVGNKDLDPTAFSYLSAKDISQNAIDEYGFDSQGTRERVTLRVVKDFTFKGDETACIYILFNLLKNALHYFKNCPNATITITVDDQKITVTDTGPGIPERHLNSIFKSFSTVGKANGTGLGLAYCNRTMRNLGGKIQCESVVDQYTSFVMTFPAVPQSEIDAHNNQIFQAGGLVLKHKRVLVVDDEDSYHIWLNSILTGFGCHVAEAKNGQVAIDMLQVGDFDLVVMDLRMPIKDGYAATLEIRAGAIARYKNIAIVAHTSEAPSTARIKTQQVGMDGFLSKPCTRLELVNALVPALEIAALRSRLEMSINRLKDKTILVVDDEMFNHDYVEVIANALGLKTLHADSGLAAMQILENVPQIDFILMDMRMPVLNGVETAKRIRSNPAWNHIVIVAHTGNSDEGAIRETLAAGMNGFITKPVNKISLQETLIKLMRVDSRSVKVDAIEQSEAVN